MNFSFFIRFLFREIFSKKNYSMQIVFSIAIGVGAIVGINSYRNSLNQAILKESENLMGGDLLVESSERYSPEKKNFLDSILPENAKRSQFVNFNSMIYNPVNQETALSAVRAVEPSFPLRGKLETIPPNVFQKMQNDEILLDSGLAKSVKAEIGEKLILGKKKYQLIGFIKKEPGSTGNLLSLAPSSIIHLDSLAETGLEARGSRIRYNILLRLPEYTPSRQFKEKHFPSFIKNDMTLYHSTEMGSGTRRFISSTLDYMSLLGISALFLGTISVIISVRANVKEKLGEIAVIKCLGGDSSFYGRLFIFEILTLAILGTVIGIGAGYLLQYAMPNLTGIDFLVTIKPVLTIRSLAYGFVAGCIIPVVVIFEAILKAKTVAPMYALKSHDEFLSGSDVSFRKIHLIGAAIAYTLFFLFAALETENYFYALLLSSLLCALPLTQFGAYLLLKKITLSVVTGFHFGSTLEFTLKKFTRPKNEYILSIIGISSTLTILILTIIFRASLLAMGGVDNRDAKANMFVLDIAEKEKPEFEKISREWDVSRQIIAPVIGARLKSINFKPIEKEKTEKDALKRDWRATARTREYFLSYRKSLYESEKLIAGKFWEKASSENQISVESDFAKILSVGLNDTLQFNVQGLEVSGRITNLRTVSWSDMRPNFVVIFSPNALENAPRYYLSSFRIDDSDKRYDFQKRIIKGFPSATIVDIEKASKNFLGILEKISGIVHLISLFIILSSFVLFLASLYVSKAQRLEETSLLRVLGADNSFIRKIYAIEGLLFGSFSFLISIFFALVIEHFVSGQILNVTTKIPIGEILLLFFITVFLISATFVFHVNGILGKPPKNYFQN